jgi:hypothetical protein
MHSTLSSCVERADKFMLQRVKRDTAFANLQRYSVTEKVEVSEFTKLEDELKKLGLRVRPRKVERRAEPRGKPGQISFDDRGNAVSEWSNDRLAEESEQGEQARDRALTYHGLSIVEDDEPKNAPIRNNTKGLRVGYNPYESGLLPHREQPKKKRDLRELSKWLEMKKRVNDKSED